MLICVHDGVFHLDDVLAIEMARILYPSAKLMRTRDEAVLERAELLLDVGRKLDPGRGRFDHHQADVPQRKNGKPYAAAGLLWREKGAAIVAAVTGINGQIAPVIAEMVDEKLVALSDAADNGVGSCSLSDVVLDLNPLSSAEQDRAFEFARELVERRLRNEIERAAARLELRPLLAAKANERIVVLERPIPEQVWSWETTSHPQLLVVVQPAQGLFEARAVPKSPEGRNWRALFPREWARLAGAELNRIAGIATGVFVSGERNLAVARELTDALFLAKQVLPV